MPEQEINIGMLGKYLMEAKSLNELFGVHKSYSSLSPEHKSSIDCLLDDSICTIVENDTKPFGTIAEYDAYGRKLQEILICYGRIEKSEKIDQMLRKVWDTMDKLKPKPAKEEEQKPSIELPADIAGIKAIVDKAKTIGDLKDVILDLEYSKKPLELGAYLENPKFEKYALESINRLLNGVNKGSITNLMYTKNYFLELEAIAKTYKTVLVKTGLYRLEDAREIMENLKKRLSTINNSVFVRSGSDWLLELSV